MFEEEFFQTAFPLAVCAFVIFLIARAILRPIIISIKRIKWYNPSPRRKQRDEEQRKKQEQQQEQKKVYEIIPLEELHTPKLEKIRSDIFLTEQDAEYYAHLYEQEQERYTETETQLKKAKEKYNALSEWGTLTQDTATRLQREISRLQNAIDRHDNRMYQFNRKRMIAENRKQQLNYKLHGG